MTPKLIIYKNSEIIENLTLGGLLDFEISWNIGGIADPVGQIGNWIVSTIGGYLNSAVSALEMWFGPAINAAMSTVNSVINSLLSGVNNMVALVQQLPGSITGMISGLVNSIQSVVGGIVTQLSASLATISSAISSGFSQIISTVSNSLSQVSRTLTQIVPTITAAIQGIVGQIGGLFQTLASTLSSFGSQLMAAIQTAFSQITQIFNNVGTVLRQFSDQISSAVTDSLKKITDYFNTLNIPGILTKFASDLQKYFNALNISGILNKFVSTLEKMFDQLSLPNLTDIFAFVQKFGKDPIGTIRGVVDDVLKTFGLPTTGEITSAIEQFFKNNPVQASFAFPENFTKFINFMGIIIDKLTETHSPSMLDDIWNGLTFWFSKLTQGMWNSAKTGFYGPVAQLVALFTQIEWNTDGSVKSAELGWPKLEIGTNIIDYFKNLGKDMIPGLQKFGESVMKGLTDVGNWIVDGVIATFNLPKPNEKITDPFGKMFDSLFQVLQKIAGLSQTKTPVVTEVVMTVISEVAGAVMAGEALEWTGLAIDASHPIKNWQLREKFKGLIDKIGLGHVTGVVGASLVGASLSPLLMRFWNKQSQVRLAGVGELIEMFHRGVFGEKVLDEYLSEHGLDARFRSGLKENFWKIPNFDLIIRAYLRMMNDGQIARADVEKELEKYLDVFDLRPKAREGFKFSERELLFKMLYRGISRFERRSLNAIGLLDEKTATTVFAADRVKPDLIPLLVKAERLQGLQTYRDQIKSKVTERVTKGFIVLEDFSKTLTDNEYAKSAVDYLVKANELDIQTTIDEARLKELDQSYAQATMERSEYEKGVKDVIKNPDIATKHIAISDLTRTRNNETRIRDEGNLAVSYELAAFAQGAVTVSEFNDLASAMGKTPAEIERLETARGILLDNKIRTVKFATLQYLLAKRQITVTQFKTHAKRLKIDANLVDATADKTVAQSLTKAKTANPTADERVFNLYPTVA